MSKTFFAKLLLLLLCIISLWFISSAVTRRNLSQSINDASKDKELLIAKLAAKALEDKFSLTAVKIQTLSRLPEIKEGDKTRLQAFEGLVLARKHGMEAGATFTVRKVSDGIGVERIFPLYSPVIEKIEILRRGNIRRAKLYYVREKAQSEARRKMKQTLYTAPKEEAPSE